MDALRQGHTPPPPDGDEYSEHEALFWQTMPFDADLFRAAMEIMSALTLPRDIYTRPEIMNRAEAVAKQLPVDAPATPGTSRAELLAAINSSKV